MNSVSLALEVHYDCDLLQIFPQFSIKFSNCSDLKIKIKNSIGSTGLSALAMCAPSEKFLNMGGPLAVGLGVVFASSVGKCYRYFTARCLL